MSEIHASGPGWRLWTRLNLATERNEDKMKANSIFAKFAESCDRADCRFVLNEYGITNSAGSYTGAKCLSCCREWSIFSPAFQGQEFDRAGTHLNPSPRVEIKEIHNHISRQLDAP